MFTNSYLCIGGCALPKRVLQSPDFTVNRVPMKLYKSSNTAVISGVARNLSREEQIRGRLGDGSPPSGSRGGARVWGSGAKPPEAVEFTTKMFQILIAR